MTFADFGNNIFALAVLAAAAGVFAAIAAGRTGSAGLLAWARTAACGFTALILANSIALLMAFKYNHYDLHYVAAYSSKDMPTAYKCVAFWAGQEGSLLLWTLMLAGMTCIVAFTGRRASTGAQAAPLAILLAVGACFTLLMLTVPEANPFRPADVVRQDGRTMNPLLQDPAMIVHPPALFLGYAASTVPFALVVGATLVGRKDREWLGAARRWAIAAWGFLTLGNLLGSYWAYYEQGWGGYWFWDAVENASFIPWFTAFALAHALLMFQRRGSFKGWSLHLAAGTFLLCLLAAFITRSGLFISVHAFDKSPVGWYILAMMGMSLALWIGVLIARWPDLRPERPLERLVSLDGAIHLTNILAVLCALTTAVGTLFPLIAKGLKYFFDINIVPGTFDPQRPGAELNLLPAFYDTVVLPMAMALVVLMALAPVLRTLRNGLGELARRLLIPIVPALLAGGAAVWITADHLFDRACLSAPGKIAAFRSANPHAAPDALPASIVNIHGHTVDLVNLIVGYAWTGVCAGAVALGVFLILQEILRLLARGFRDSSVSPLVCLGRTLATQSPWLGAQLVHLGILMLCLGVMGSALNVIEVDPNVPPGKSFTAGPYTLTPQPIKSVEGPNWRGDESRVDCVGPNGHVRTLHAQIRAYHGWRDPLREVAVRSTLLDDVCVILLGTNEDEGGRDIFFKVKVVPMVNWMWLGGIVMTAGGILCLLRVRAPRAGRDEPDPAADSAVS